MFSHPLLSSSKETNDRTGNNLRRKQKPTIRLRSGRLDGPVITCQENVQKPCLYGFEEEDRPAGERIVPDSGSDEVNHETVIEEIIVSSRYRAEKLFQGDSVFLVIVHQVASNIYERRSIMSATNAGMAELNCIAGVLINGILQNPQSVRVTAHVDPMMIRTRWDRTVVTNHVALDKDTGAAGIDRAARARCIYVVISNRVRAARNIQAVIQGRVLDNKIAATDLAAAILLDRHDDPVVRGSIGACVIAARPDICSSTKIRELLSIWKLGNTRKIAASNR